MQSKVLAVSFGDHSKGLPLVQWFNRVRKWIRAKVVSGLLQSEL